MTKPPILVALDGSRLSESALTHAVLLARATGADLLLITVWEGVEGPAEIDGAAQVTQQGEAECRRYLGEQAKRLSSEGLAVETEVRAGNAGEEILRVVEQREPRLLVLASHGRSGLSRWRYGSVASRLAREAPAPTVVIGPRVLEAGVAPAVVRRILVPLDGSALAEAALAPAVALAQALKAELLLAEALRWTAQAFVFGVPEVNVAQLDRELTAAAEEYLGRVKAGLRTEQPVATRVVHGFAAEALMDLVEAEQVDLVVMASHSRAGVARTFLGSVADRMLQARAPVMLVRPEGVSAVARAPRGRYCHLCGRASPFVEVTPEDRCLRCGTHLHICSNCVYFDGMACLVQRPEVHDTYPGLNCPYFQFRETEKPAPAGTAKAKS